METKEQKQLRPEYHHQWYVTHREQQLRSQKEYTTSHKDQVRSYQKKYRANHQKQTRLHRVEIKKKVIELLGGKCARCDNTDWRVLQVDHVHGGGRKDVKRFGGSGSFYQHILRSPKSGKYQLLCANCNWVKKYENSEN